MPLHYCCPQVEFGNNTTHSFSFFVFQWAFAAACATIMAGAVAERIRVPAYMGYTVLMSGLVGGCRGCRAIAAGSSSSSRQ